jgi:hypothetical protein
MKADLILSDVGESLPPATQYNQGKFLLLRGDGADDILYVCIKETAGTYAWIDLAATGVGGGTTITVQEGDVTSLATVDTVDFDASDFNVSTTLANEANISLAYGTSAGTPAEGNHTHANDHVAATVLDSASINMGISGQQITAAAIFGTSATTIAQGNHTHANDHVAATVLDTASINMTLSGQQISADAIFGTSATTIAQGNHSHANDHVPVTVADTASIDLTLSGQQVSAAAIFGTGAGTVAEGNHTHVGGGSTIIVQEGDVTIDAAADTLDFDGSDFNLTLSPAGEVNVALAYGLSAGTPAEGNHDHAGTYSPVAHTHTATYAPIAAKYIVQTADGDLTAEQALGALATGIVKNTTTTGVLSIAASGTDYAPATSGSAILKGNGSGGFSAAVAGTDYALSTDNLSDAAVSSLAVGQVLASSNGTSFANLTWITANLGPFYTFNTAGSTSVQFGIIEPTASGTQVITIQDYYAGLAGRVVGMYLNSNADWTAGTATGRVYLDGVAQTFAAGACVLSTTNRRRHSAFVSFANGLAFTATQRIGMGITTSGWTPTTADFNGLLVVAYTPF